jgi:hypothetical protein
MYNTYNGWKNRQTWLVNMHFGDYFTELAEEGHNVTADFIRDTVDEHFQEQVKDLSMFVQDLIDDAGIDWDELAAHYAMTDEDRGVLEHAAWYDTSAELA